MKENKSVGTVQKFTRQITERGNLDISNTCMHGRSISQLGTQLGKKWRDKTSYRAIHHFNGMLGNCKSIMAE
jgi:hypothetical protein